MKFNLTSQQLEKENEDLWLTSYADLISAVLAVLVLFVSFSKIDVDKLDSVQRAISNNNTCPSITEIKKDLSKTAKNCGVDKQVGFDLVQEGLNVNFEAALFDSGKAKIESNKLLSRCENLMVNLAKISHMRKIDISGHTDDLRTKQGSNWTLSANRAVSMYQYLLQFNIAHQGVRLIAYADTLPKVDIKNKKNQDLLDARSQNRRVNITIKSIKRDSKCH